MNSNIYSSQTNLLMSGKLPSCLLDPATLNDIWNSLKCSHDIETLRQFLPCACTDCSSSDSNNVIVHNTSDNCMIRVWSLLLSRWRDCHIYPRRPAYVVTRSWRETVAWVHVLIPEVGGTMRMEAKHPGCRSLGNGASSWVFSCRSKTSLLP